MTWPYETLPAGVLLRRFKKVKYGTSGSTGAFGLVHRLKQSAKESYDDENKGGKGENVLWIRTPRAICAYMTSVKDRQPLSRSRSHRIAESST